jgi:hypothetical protein
VIDIQRSLLPAAVLALGLAIVVPLPAQSTLPAAVDGQTLPTLAPML